jgi:hypothetical protein
VFLRVVFGRLVMMVLGVEVVAMRDVRVMGRLLGVAGFVMLRGFFVMSGCVLAMFRCVLVMLRSSLMICHAVSPSLASEG